ncbi:MAG: 3-hydroxylacyl-ACP dehydratase [Lysobacteraceae bacterium]|nr:MAG: 3-hydroxylacyl-ACP dehydratase [Xanthomonadaceae bacterium]
MRYAESPEGLPPVSVVVPHRPPMLFLRRIVRAQGDSLEADLVVDALGPFGDGFSVPAWVGIEYMAQAVAAWAGLRSHQTGGSPRPGFLLGTRRYECERDRWQHGTELVVQVHCELLGENGMGAFRCSLIEDRRSVASARLAVFEPPDLATYLGGKEA